MSQQSLSDSSIEDGIFDGLSAWFSSSVSTKRVNTWKSNGGCLDDEEDALYLFSENADAPDTRRLYTSKACLRDHLAIFHAAFIDEALIKGNCRDIVMGNFVLPPSELHPAFREKLGSGWLRDQLKVDVEKPPLRSNFLETGYEFIEDLPKIVGPLREFVAGKNGCEVSMKC